MIIKDLLSKKLWDIWEPRLLKVTYVGFDTIEGVNGIGEPFKFRMGDAIMAGIEIPKTKSVFDYANAEDEPQHGDILNESRTTEDP